MKLQLPSGPFEGYIFDCDGTLADTMPLAYQAWIEVLEEEGVTFFSEEEYQGMGGTTLHVVVECLNARGGTCFQPGELVQRQQEAYLRKLGAVRPIEPVVAYARTFKDKGMPVAVASGGLRPIVEETLARIGLEGFFPVIVTPERGVRPKPFPDMFLLAAREMGIAPLRTLVFEDADFGIQAAKAAGMSFVRVPLLGPTPA